VDIGYLATSPACDYACGINFSTPVLADKYHPCPESVTPIR